MWCSKPAARQFWQLTFSLSSGAMTLLFYVLIVHRYGVGKSSDLVFALALLPSVFYTVTFGQLNEILVPFFVARERPELQATAFWNVSAAVAGAGAACGGIALFPMASLAPILFPAATASWPASLIRHLLLSATAYNLFFCLLVVKNAYLVSVGRAVLMQFIMTLGNAASVLWLWRFGRADAPLQIPLAQIAGVTLALLCPAAWSKFASYVPGHLAEHLQDAFVRVRWLILHASFARTEPLFDGIIAGLLGRGAITVYYLFQRIVGFSLAAVQTGYILPFTKETSELACHPGALRRALHRGAIESSGLSLALLLASAVGLILMQFPPVAALQAYAGMYQRHALVFYLLFGYGVFTLTAKTYATGLYVIRQERLFTLVSIAVFLLGVGLKILASRYWGLPGLALASSLAGFALASALALAFWRASRRPAGLPVTRPIPQHLGAISE